MDWIGGFDDRGGRVAGPPRETLPKLFSEEGHERVDHCKAALERCVQGLLGRFLLRGRSILDECFRVFDVDVTKVRVPVLVRDGGGLGELSRCERAVDVGSGCSKFMQDPAFGEGFVRRFRWVGGWGK